MKKLIYGCMNLGGEWNSNPIESGDEKKAFSAIEAAISCGIDTFDFADIYTFGKSECIFGKFLTINKRFRDLIKIQSKAGICINKGYNKSNTYNLSANYLIHSIEQILQRLKIDFLDTFLIHRPDPLTHPSEIAETLWTIKEKGLAKKIGVSNMCLAQINAIQNFFGIELILNQIQFSLLHTKLIDNNVFFNTSANQDLNTMGLLELSQIYEFELQAWSPLDKGLLLNDISNQDTECIKNTKKLVSELSKKYNVEKSAVLLAWIFRIPARISPIIGSINPKRIRSCNDSRSIELSREDWYNLWIVSKGINLP